MNHIFGLESLYLHNRYDANFTCADLICLRIFDGYNGQLIGKLSDLIDGSAVER